MISWVNGIYIYDLSTGAASETPSEYIREVSCLSALSFWVLDRM